VRLDLPPGVDPLAVLDAARARGPVTDFGLDLPTLSQLFLAAVEDGEQTGVTEAGAA
jgi:ABC-2 type transport system ATP-binding protein